MSAQCFFCYHRGNVSVVKELFGLKNSTLLKKNIDGLAMEFVSIVVQIN